MVTWLRPPTKRLRAEIIARYLHESRITGAVVFSCGNASAALKATVPYVIAVAPGGDLLAARWWSPAEIHRAWPHLFDATSGHLPMPIMVQLSHALRGYLGDLDQVAYRVPTGSGETVMALRWAYPGVLFTAVFDDTNPATTYEKQAPLMDLVAATGPVLYTGM